MTRRPWRLKTFVGGLGGTVDRTRSFATRDAAESALMEARKHSRVGKVYRVSEPPRGAT